MSPHDAKCADRAAEPDLAPDARTLADRLDDAGVSRRRFLTFCAAMVATLALPERFAPRVAAALSQ
ncbi:twin-arginine translocation signal domain-containing protein, partial [Mycobacterium sp.]|uniref:twin-arginine translocation signal domain-containing protein n=1 Tax=Mycobacterium sp. TaxID=1785 RepID=UPI003C77DFDD